MKSDLLPPASVEHAAAFEVSDAKIDYTSMALGGSVLFVIYPAYELLRCWWGGGTSMFSWSSTAVAPVCAALFGWNVRRRVRGLARFEPGQSPAGASR